MEARLTNKELGGGHSKWCSGNHTGCWRSNPSWSRISHIQSNLPTLCAFTPAPEANYLNIKSDPNPLSYWNQCYPPISKSTSFKKYLAAGHSLDLTGFCIPLIKNETEIVVILYSQHDRVWQFWLSVQNAFQCQAYTHSHTCIHMCAHTHLSDCMYIYFMSTRNVP